MLLQVDKIRYVIMGECIFFLSNTDEGTNGTDKSK